jgi:hypothetical protein
MLTWSHIWCANVLKQAHAHKLDHRKEMRIQLWLIWPNQNQANQGCNVLMMHINSHLVDLGTMRHMKHQAMTILLNKLQSERRPWKKWELGQQEFGPCNGHCESWFEISKFKPCLGFACHLTMEPFVWNYWN